MELKVFMSFMEMAEVRAILFMDVDEFFVCTLRIFPAFGKFQYRKKISTKSTQKFFE
jgi:hypothetical protein